MAKFWLRVGKAAAALLAIAVVIAILFPVGISDHYEKWRQTVCLGNDKQIGLALLEYTQDYNGLMPNISDSPTGKNTWRAAIYSYIKNKSVYRCPDDDAPAGPDGFPPSYAANYSGTYNGGPLDKGNGAFAGPGSYVLSLPKFADPAHFILLCEVQQSPAPEFNIDDSVRFGPNSAKMAVRHAGGSNYLFADGHAKWWRPLGTAPFWYQDPHRPLSLNALSVLRNAHG